jgi:hypothetical protein
MTKFVDNLSQDLISGYIYALYNAIFNSGLSYADFEKKRIGFYSYIIGKKLDNKGLIDFANDVIINLNLVNRFNSSIDLINYFGTIQKSNEEMLYWSNNAYQMLVDHYTNPTNRSNYLLSFGSLLKSLNELELTKLFEESIDFVKSTVDNFNIKDKPMHLLYLAQAVHKNTTLAYELIKEATSIIESVDFKQQIFFNTSTIPTELYIAYQNNEFERIDFILGKLEILDDVMFAESRKTIIKEFYDIKTGTDHESKLEKTLKNFLMSIFKYYNRRTWSNNSEKWLFENQIFKIVKDLPFKFIIPYRFEILEVIKSKNDSMLKFFPLTKAIMLHKLNNISNEEFEKKIYSKFQNFSEEGKTKHRPNFHPEDINVLMSYALTTDSEYWTKSLYYEFFVQKLKVAEQGLNNENTQDFLKNIGLIHSLNIDDFFKLLNETELLDKSNFFLAVMEYKYNLGKTMIKNKEDHYLWTNFGKSLGLYKLGKFNRAFEILHKDIDKMTHIVSKLPDSINDNNPWSENRSYWILYTEMNLLLIELDAKLKKHSHTKFLSVFEEKKPDKLINLSKVLAKYGFTDSAKRIVKKYYDDPKYYQGMIQETNGTLVTGPATTFQTFYITKANILRLINSKSDAKIALLKGLEFRTDDLFVNNFSKLLPELLYLEMEELLEETLIQYFKFIKENPMRLLHQPLLKHLDLLLDEKEEIPKNMYLKGRKLLLEAYKDLLTYFTKKITILPNTASILYIISIVLKLDNQAEVKPTLDLLLSSLENYLNKNEMQGFIIESIKINEDFALILPEEIERLLTSNVNILPMKMNPQEHFDKLYKEKEKMLIPVIQNFYGSLSKLFQQIGEQKLTELCKKNSSPNSKDIYNISKRLSRDDLVSSTKLLIKNQKYKETRVNMKKIIENLKLKKFNHTEQTRTYIDLLKSIEEEIQSH